MKRYTPFSRVVTIAAVSLSALVLTAPASSQALTNQDNCINACLDLRKGPGAFPWDNIAATTGVEGQAEPACYTFGTSAIQSDIWWHWRPTLKGVVTMDTCVGGGTNADTKIAAYVGPNCPPVAPGTALDCDDDTCGLRSSITFMTQCDETYIIQMGSFPGSADGTAVINVAEVGPPCPPNITYICQPPAPNSTGAGAVLSFSGNRTQLNGPYTGKLTTVNLPPNQFGYFLASKTAVAPVPVSNGFLCLGQDIARLIGPGQPGVQNSGAAGVFNANLNMNVIPTNNPPNVPVVPGDVWYFQCWYRDPGPAGPRSNFSDACCVTFN
ncbi:MAG: hypothetical protein GY711_33130 [bacterium]|nr:hypothetical protein [bacterium]